jgi:hypothetical protein
VFPLTSEAVTPVSEVRLFTAATMSANGVPDVKSISSTPRSPPIWSVTELSAPFALRGPVAGLHEQGALLGRGEHVDLDLELLVPMNEAPKIWALVISLDATPLVT